MYYKCIEQKPPIMSMSTPSYNANSVFIISKSFKVRSLYVCKFYKDLT